MESRVFFFFRFEERMRDGEEKNPTSADFRKNRKRILSPPPYRDQGPQRRRHARERRQGQGVLLPRGEVQEGEGEEGHDCFGGERRDRRRKREEWVGHEESKRRERRRCRMSPLSVASSSPTVPAALRRLRQERAPGCVQSPSRRRRGRRAEVAAERRARNQPKKHQPIGEKKVFFLSFFFR